MEQYIQSTTPQYPTTGDEWWDTTDNNNVVHKTFNGAEWLSETTGLNLKSLILPVCVESDTPTINSNLSHRLFINMNDSKIKVRDGDSFVSAAKWEDF